MDLIADKLGDKFPEELRGAQKLRETNVWTGDSAEVSCNLISNPVIIEPYGNITLIMERA